MRLTCEGHSLFLIITGYSRDLERLYLYQKLLYKCCFGVQSQTGENMWPNSQYLGTCNNRFGTMGEDMAGDMAGDFETVRSKRRKRDSTEDSDSRDIFLLSSPENKLNMIFKELREIRVSQETANRGMINFQNCFVSMNEKLGQVVDVTNTNTSVLKTLAYKSIDLEARSRRNNLIFWGFVEIPNENSFAIIRGFIADKLDLDPQNMYITRAHRLGPRRIGSRNPRRPIIVNFRDFCDTEIIMERTHMLRNTPYSVGYDLPKEINDARKNLWQELKAVKARQPRAKAHIVYPAKLVVDGRVVRDEFPDWNDAMRGSRLSDFSHIDRNFGLEQPTMNHCDMQDAVRNNTTLSCCNESVMSDITVCSKNHSISHSVSERSRDHMVGHKECSNNGILQRSESMEMAVQNPTLNNESQQSDKTCERSRSPSAQSQRKSVSPEKSELFRPFDYNRESEAAKSSTKKHEDLPSENRSNSRRRSRPVERGLMRPISFSPATRTQHKTVIRETGSTSSINKQSVPQNSSRSKQTETGGQLNASLNNTPTHCVPQNNSTGGNDESSA